MQYWYSISNISASLQDKLAKAGLKPLSSANPDIEPQNVLLIYSAPNQVLEQKRLEESTATKCDEIHVHYEELSLLSLKYKNISSSWRLDLLDITSIRRLCNGEDPQLDKSNNFPSLKPLSSLLTLAIAKKEPRIIDIYLNLELKSCLFGLEADSNYIQRLIQSSLTDLVLMDWWEVNLDREASFEEVRNSVNQLAQIQNDYESLMKDNEQLKNLLRKQKSKNALLLDEIKELRKSSTNQSLSNKLDIEEHNLGWDNDERTSQESGIDVRQSSRQLETKNSDKKRQFYIMVLQKLLRLVSRKAQ